MQMMMENKFNKHKHTVVMFSSSPWKGTTIMKNRIKIYSADANNSMFKAPPTTNCAPIVQSDG